MAKQMPKYMVKKVERMNDLMQQIVDLNFEVEDWMERNGVKDAFDFTFDHRDSRGYGVVNVAEFVRAVNAAVNGEE